MEIINKGVNAYTSLQCYGQKGDTMFALPCSSCCPDNVSCADPRYVCN
jgi:hypothetical protein